MSTLKISEFDGGYLKSQQNTPGNERGQTQVPRSQESNTIRSVTIAQLNQATSKGELSTDVLQIDGIEVSHLILCGVIQSIDKLASNMMYTIDDGTGSCTIKHFKAANDDLSQYQTEDEGLMEGAWCMVCGHSRTWDQDYFVNVFRIRPITDHNEISFHFASCIRQHLYFTKGPLPSNVESKAKANTGSAPEQGTQRPGAGDNTGKDLTSRIADILMHHKDRDVSLDEICQKVQGDFSPQAVQFGLNTLAHEGRVLNTVHDDCYRWSG